MTPDNRKLFDFLKAFLLPTILGKILILYFGIAYSAYPDHGYGYALAFSVAFSVTTLLRLAWKYRDHEEL